MSSTNQQGQVCTKTERQKKSIFWSYLNEWAIISLVEKWLEMCENIFFREVGILLQLSFPNMILISFLPPSPTFRPDLSIYHLFRFPRPAKRWIFPEKKLAGKHQG